METKIKVVTPTMKANDDLFYKMQVEFEETLEAITKLSCEEMFKKKIEVAMKEIILKCMEVRDISYVAASGLLKLDCPLDYIYVNYNKSYLFYDSYYELIEDIGKNISNAFTNIK